MNTISPQWIDELLAYLDRQEQVLERVLAFLDAFRGSLIRRDAAALERMQGQLEEEGRLWTEMEMHRRRLTERFAAVFGCRAEEVCLSAIGRRAEPMQQKRLQERQARLKDLTERLRQQHLATELLVREYARLNRQMLEVLTGSRGQGRLYDAHGRSGGVASTGLMSVQG